MNQSKSRDTTPAKTPAATCLVLVLWGEELAAWQIAPGSAPRAVRLHGQERVNANSEQAIVAAFADAAERLRGDGTRLGKVHWLADAAGRRLWVDSLPLVQTLPDSPIWQLLAWEWLVERFGLNDAAPWTISDLLTRELLPWLVTADTATERHQMQDALAREHHSESARLAAERDRLQHDNERLRTQNAALQQVDAERLVSFLPALFPRVFTVLGATDLALLCGRLEPLPIPNPYPEPSVETLHTLQRNFRALPHERQREIVRFVAHLPQRQKLEPRPELRDLLHELEED